LAPDAEVGWSLAIERFVLCFGENSLSSFDTRESARMSNIGIKGWAEADRITEKLLLKSNNQKKTKGICGFLWK
jgi:hypothetical protein